MSWIVFGVVLPWLFVGLCCWVGYQLIRQNGRILLQLEAMEQRLAALHTAPAAREPAAAAPQGLPIGSPAPAVELPDLTGGRKSLVDFRGKKLLVVFFNPGCGFCTQMAPDLAVLPPDGESGKPIPLVITTGDAEENRKLFAKHGVKCPVLVQEGMEVASQYQCHGTPMGYLIDEQGHIASAQAVGAQALLELKDGATAPIPANGNGHGALGGKRALAESKIPRHGLTAGTAAPDFTLPRLDGGDLSLAEFRGRQVLLVFSDPHCGPCDQLAPQLEQLSPRAPGAQVLMVTRGDEKANRMKAAEHGLTFPVVLQKQWEVSREYGMFATPIAYLIDEEGVIAADVAAGVEPILALLDAAATAEPTERRCPCGKPAGQCRCSQKAKATAGRRNGQ
jgi:peroxiredoxin